jgi:hypothetical protein
LRRIAGGGKQVQLVDYVNVPRNIGAVISAGHARMVELQTVLGTQDLYDLLEIIQIDSHNQALMRAK